MGGHLSSFLPLGDELATTKAAAEEDAKTLFKVCDDLSKLKESGEGDAFAKQLEDLEATHARKLDKRVSAPSLEKTFRPTLSRARERERANP